MRKLSRFVKQLVPLSKTGYLIIVSSILAAVIIAMAVSGNTEILKEIMIPFVRIITEIVKTLIS